MPAPEKPVSPLVVLATSYGGAHTRSWCHALFAFDAQLAGIVLQAREPMLAQIRLQWWYDVIGKPARDRPVANPVLAALAPLEADGLDLLTTLGPVIRGWEAALDLVDGAAVHSFAQGRGALFSAFHPLVPGADREHLGRIGAAWALWDMVRFHGADDVMVAALLATDTNALGRPRLPRALRPLSIIARAVQLDIARGQMDRPWASAGMFGALVWHGLTGR